MLVSRTIWDWRPWTTELLGYQMAYLPGREAESAGKAFGAQLEGFDGAYLFTPFFSFRLSFFLWSKLGLFLFFLFSFVFTSLVTHICFSVFENECSTAIVPFHRMDWLHKLATRAGCPHRCKEADERSPASLSKQCLWRLGQLDVFGPWSLFPTPFGVRHALPFGELFECHPFEVR